MSKAEKPEGCFLSSISRLSPDSKDSRNQGMHKTLANDGELAGHTTATYWG